MRPRPRRRRWSDDRIWAELQARVGGPTGSRCSEGPITDKTVLRVPQLRLRADALRPAAAGRRRRAHRAADRRQGPQPGPGRRAGAGRGAGAGDPHAATPERARGRTRRRALARVWRAQHFSYWMTTMLHRLPDALGLRRAPAAGRAGARSWSPGRSAYLAEGYTGWPGMA